MSNNSELTIIQPNNVFSVFISSLLRVSEGAMAGLQCYIGNCTSMEACRRPELVTDCPHDQAYDACLSIIVQKGRLLSKWSSRYSFIQTKSFFSFPTEIENSPIKYYINVLCLAQCVSSLLIGLLLTLLLLKFSPSLIWSLELTLHCALASDLRSPKTVAGVWGQAGILITNIHSGLSVQPRKSREGKPQ